MSARILVVGAGAIGGIAAAHLALSGRDVTVLDANEQHVQRLRDPGLTFDHLGRTNVVRLDAVTTPNDLEGRFDFALLTLKAGFLAPALTGLLEKDCVDTYVCFGNGLVQDRVAALVGPDRMLVGITEWGGTNLGPGHLAQTTVAPFIVGEPAGGDSDRLRRLADALSPVAEVQISTDIASIIWTKLLLNSTFSGLGAVSGGLYSDVAAHDLGRRVAYRVWTEGYDIAVAAGIALDELLGVDPRRLVVRRVEDERNASAALDTIVSHLGATKASMLQDLERGATTEVDVINGGVVSVAARLGLPPPRGNAAIVDFIHECEAGISHSGPAAYARIADAIGMSR